MAGESQVFDASDLQELTELLGLLIDWAEAQERDENYASAVCLRGWAEEVQSRLTWLTAYLQYGQGSVSS
jgi:hypothetical protein